MEVNFQIRIKAITRAQFFKGRQGIRNKVFQYLCYAFYPVHMLALFAVREWMLK